MSASETIGDSNDAEQGMSDTPSSVTVIPSLAEVQSWVHSEDCATHFDGPDDPTSDCDCGYDQVLAMAVELHRLTHG